ncbi:hypothetical protein [Thermoplasma volcanium]|nr:hypothetical protein [Thermoplasma volcanium]
MDQKLLNEWNYGKFRVFRYERPECKEKFKYYVSNDGKTFTIPKVE